MVDKKEEHKPNRTVATIIVDLLVIAVLVIILAVGLVTTPTAGAFSYRFVLE